WPGVGSVDSNLGSEGYMRYAGNWRSGVRGKNCAKLAVIVGAAISAVPWSARATTATWIGTNGSWGDAANWAGSSALPPNTNSSECFLDNNSQVSLSAPGSSFICAALHVGFNSGALPGTSKLTIDTGTLNVAQNLTVGEGSDGSIIVNGGALVVASSKNF